MDGPTPPTGDRDADLRADERAELGELERWLASAGAGDDDEDEDAGGDDLGFDDPLAAWERAEAERGYHEERGLELRRAQDWLDEWTQIPAHYETLAGTLAEYQGDLPAARRAAIARAIARMSAAVKELTGAVWMLRDHNEDLADASRQRAPR